MSVDVSGLRGVAREHALAVSAVLSVVSLSLVFAAALRLVPPEVLPRASDAVLHAIPLVNVVLSLVAIATIAAGVVSARCGRYRRHRALMLTSTALFATFLALYLYRVALLGPTPFPGPDVVYRTVYLPLLAVHVTLAVVCVPLVVYVLTLAATRPIPALFETNHARVARIAAPLWVVSFTLGVVVYAMLYVVY